MLNDRQLMEAYAKIQEAEYGSKKPETKTDEGAKDAPKEFDVGNVDKKAENKRDEGAGKAPDEFDGKKESVGAASNDKGKEGAKNAPQKYESISEYKNRLRGALGLPLDSKLNQGNKGI